MALHKRLTLKRGERLTALVATRLQHFNNIRRARVLKALNERRMNTKVPVQFRPGLNECEAIFLH